jgi:hypothetical protein
MRELFNGTYQRGMEARQEIPVKVSSRTLPRLSQSSYVLIVLMGQFLRVHAGFIGNVDYAALHFLPLSVLVYKKLLPMDCVVHMGY